MSDETSDGGYTGVKDDNLSFRRGLVLGLTLAEISILVIFIVLLAFGVTLAKTSAKVHALERELPAERASQALLRTLAKGAHSDQEAQDLAQKLIAGAVRQAELDQLRKERDAARRERDALKGVVDGARNASNGQPLSAKVIEDVARGQSQWPPFFNLSEAGGYFFDSGKATLHPDFEISLRDRIIPKLVNSVAQYHVNVVEVIGHTDEVPMSGTSNLDTKLIPAAAGKDQIAELRSTDNAGLAMARAVAVARILRADPRLSHVSILPLSGAQMIVPIDHMADGRARGDDQHRRRIEIRLRRTSEQSN